MTKQKGLRYRHVLRGTAMAVCLLIGLILVTGASESGQVVIDPNSRTVTTSNFFVAWDTGRDTEAITSISWRGGQDLTGTTGVDTCFPAFPGTVQYFGNSYAPPDPWAGGLVLVGGGTTTPPGTTAWSGQILSSGTAQVTINSSSTGCPPSSAGINVQTTYSFFNPDDPNTIWYGVQRSFDFTTTTFAHSFRPYMPRLLVSEGYAQVVYPTTSGTLATLSVGSCGFGCTGPVAVPDATQLIPPWDTTQGWFAIHNSGTLQGVVVKRQPSTDPQGNPISAQLWVDDDAGPPGTNASSFLLISPPGGFTGGLVTEVETLCFYDSTIWTPSLTPPAACSNGPVTLSPSTLTFGSQSIGTTSAPETVTLTNTGNAPVTISNIAITGINGEDFAQTNTCGGSVAVEANCTISVIFTPSASGSRAASLTITDSAASSPQTVSLSGTGTVATVSLSTTSLMFGSQPLGTTSTAQPVTLSNTGNAALAISSIAVSGDFGQSNNCGASIAAGSSCTINVTFTPTATGTRTGLLTVTDNSNGVAGSTQTASLSGTGTTSTGGTMSVSPTSLSFGPHVLNTTSGIYYVLVSNTGTSPLSMGATTSGDFAANSTCPNPLNIGASCKVNVTFTPAALGKRTGTLTVTSNASNSPQTVALAGTGVAAMTLWPPTAGGPEGWPRTFTLHNSMATTLNNIAISTTGELAVASTTCGSSLAAMSACTILVSFTGGGFGSHGGTLTVSDSATNSPQVSKVEFFIH